MEFTSRPYDKAHVFEIHGSLDASSSMDLNDSLTQALQNGQVRLIFDLTSLEYTSSAGLRVLLSIAKEARKQGGDVRLVAPRPEVKKVFEMSGLSNILQSYVDVNSAVTSDWPN